VSPSSGPPVAGSYIPCSNTVRITKRLTTPEPLPSYATGTVDNLRFSAGFGSANMFRNRCVHTDRRCSSIAAEDTHCHRIGLRAAQHFGIVEIQMLITINNRQSQKPSDELYKNFKANFPQFGQSVADGNAPAHGATSLTDALDIPVNTR